ncbi:MAG TPA: hypothetical protein VK879_05295 [Candidatus Sulfomarinibacteraceae bacterium]|nr:hypothetical protein [Candidatus Sulfomarinibacteraceae bacterium]
MKTNYVWREAEEMVAEETDTVSGFRPPHRRLLWLMLIAVIGAAALIVQLRQRIEGQEQALREEIVASFYLWHQALHSYDQELFLFQLADGDQAWKEAQLQLFAQDRLLDRPGFGLRYNTQDGTPEVTAIALSPDWQTATLSARYPYVLVESHERTYLQATYRFRLQEGHWLLASPDGDFWGAEQTLQRPGLSIIYAQRDAEFVQRLADDLAQDLQNMCHQLRPMDDDCPQSAAVNVRIETDPIVLAAFYDRVTPVVRKGHFVLPSPTLVGLPQLEDEDAYQALYGGYSLRLLKTAATNLRPLASPPEQDLALLCFPERGQPLRLFRYVVTDDRWVNELPTQDFRFLLGVPGGDGIILQDVPPGEVASHLRLWHWQGDEARLLLDRVVSEQVKPPAGWASSAQPRLLLHDLQENRSHRYHWLNLNDCGPTGCRLVDLSGYTTWSPYGTHTLLLDGENLWRGDHEGQRQAPLGIGLAPFWLDNERYGYVRYDRDAGAPSMQVVTATVGIDLPHIVLPVQALGEALAAETNPLTFINYVAANPGDPDLLFLWSTSVGVAKGTHAIFSYRLSTDDLRLIAQFEQLPRGDPSRLTPAGYPPFRFSPDGHWLLVTSLERLPATAWQFQLFDLHKENDQAFSVSYPAYPTPFPIYDWTPDGRWLAIIEEGFLRLLAPAAGHERVIPFRFENCLHAAWMAS